VSAAPYSIALDCMGGDHGVPVVVPAALKALDQHDDIALVLVGDEAAIAEALSRAGRAEDARLSIHPTTEVVGMDEAPAQALRGKKDSSMRVAINLVKDEVAHACVSAGNTGALMATARYVLKTLPGIDRPAICTTIPSMRGHTHVLDLGANVDCSAEHLYQFAVMGSVLARALDGAARPSVGLLNVGAEAIKGNDQVKEAGRLLGDSDLNYVGYVEGDDIYIGDVDVVVCDGFVGNVALKSSEGVARMIREIMRSEFERNWVTRLAGLAALPVLRSLRRRIDPRRYNGASLLGLQGCVIKSHGGTDSLGFMHAIDVARSEAIARVPQLIDRELEGMLAERRSA
jgi:glycerol-3-phosphate acyltransferase PlsX